MKILFMLLILNSTVFANGEYSTDDFVVCDIPLIEYPQYLKNGYFETDSLYKEGFIHCAKPSQLQYVMDTFFKEDVYVLFISHKNVLGEKLKYEGNPKIGFYPHLYRRFYKNDLLKSIIIERNSKGKFVLPKQLSK